MDFLSLDFDDPVVRLGVAALGGLAIGIEREWSQRQSGGARRFAGVRTFLLLGLIGGLAAELVREEFVVGAVVAFAAAAALAVVAYGRRANREDPDATTEVTAVVVLMAGFLAGAGRLGLASGVIAITVLVLVEKSRIHSMVARLPAPTLFAAARFGVMALVILPLLPEGPFGPEPGFRPRQLWAFVVLFSGLSFLGFVSLHAVGPRRGYGLSGLLGGLVSSTLVTLTFARESRQKEAPSGALALGAVGACTILFPRMVVLLALLRPPVAVEAVRLFWAPFLLGVIWIAWSFRREGLHDEQGGPLPENPLRLVSAMQMTLGFQLVLYAVHWARGRFGSAGLLASGGLLGVADVDALTYSMVRIDAEAATAAQVLLVGALSNTLLKLGIAIVFGNPEFRRAVAVGLGLLTAAMSAALAVSLLPGS